jgi:serine/threonine protein kinase
MSYVHGRNVIHTDLSSGNILLQLLPPDMCLSDLHEDTANPDKAGPSTWSLASAAMAGTIGGAEAVPGRRVAEKSLLSLLNTRLVAKVAGAYRQGLRQAHLPISKVRLDT